MELQDENVQLPHTFQSRCLFPLEALSSRQEIAKGPVGCVEWRKVDLLAPGEVCPLAVDHIYSVSQSCEQKQREDIVCQTLVGSGLPWRGQAMCSCVQVVEGSPLCSRRLAKQRC